MEATCQRCHETLRETDRYCSACGLPQLLYVAAETPLTPVGDGVDDLAAESDSAVLASATGGEVAWRPALRAAAMLAIPAGVLCSGLTPIGESLGLVWMVGAAAWAVALYAKHARQGWISMGNGARIGLVTGLFASWLTLGVDGVQVWLARFVQHQGVQMDADWTNYVDKVQQLDQQMIAQMGMATAQTAQTLQAQRVWMLSPEGRAGVPFMLFVVGTAFLVCFATIGGAVGARFLAQPRRPSVQR